MTGNSMLPKGWIATKVGDICSEIQYGYTASASKEQCGPRFLRITDIQNGQVIWSNVPYCSISPTDAKKFALRPRDIFFARTGGTVGKSFLINQVPEPSVFASYLIRLTASHGIDSQYLYYFFQSLSYWEQIGLKKGGLQGNVNATTLSSIELPLGPSKEQRRIVEKIEALLSELDKGVESLRTAQEQLKAYREAVLKHAFEGKLTADWRAQNPDKLKSPEALLACIRAERDARYAEELQDWQRAIAEWHAGGKVGRKPSKPARVQGQGYPDIPHSLAMRCADHWTWLRLGDVSDVTGGLTKNPKRNTLQKMMKYLRVANVYADHLELDEVAQIGVTDDEFQSVRLKLGDLLIVEGNGSVDQIGRVALWGGQIADVGHQNHLIRVRLISGMLPRFFLSFLMSPLGRDLIVRQASSTSGLHTLSISKVSALPVPVPALEEQQKILISLDAALSEIEKLTVDVELALSRCSALRESILKKAFCGQLVAQDPNDEPASVLLERIRAEKEQGSSTRRKNNKNNGKKEAA